MNDKEINQEESLQVIHEMIQKAQNRVTDDGFHFLLWGILVFIASLTQYVLIRSGLSMNSGLVWIILPVIGVPLAFYYEWRKGKTTKTQTYADKVSGYLWLGFGITLALTIFVSVIYERSPIPYILVLVGLATFVTGRIIKYVPLVLGGILFWIAGVVCVKLEPIDQLLVNAIAILLGYILPGLTLWRKYKNQDAV